MELRTANVSVVNLVHPHPVPWSVIISSASSILNVPVVPYSEWLAKLAGFSTSSGRRDEAEAARRVPALRLLEFYQLMEAGAPGRPDDEVLMQKRFDTTQMIQASKALGSPGLSSLGLEDVLRWIAYWRSKGVV